MKLKIIIAAAVLSLGLFSVGVQAQSGSDSQALQKRVQLRKEKMKQRLTEAQKERLKARCVLAQAKVRLAQKSAAKHYENQDKKVNNLIKKLTDLSKKQKDKGKDTVLLDTALKDALGAYKSVETAYDSYISALIDTADLGCRTDPEGFKASLVDARGQFQALKKARQELRQTLKGDLLAALKDFKLQNGTD